MNSIQAFYIITMLFFNIVGTYSQNNGDIECVFLKYKKLNETFLTTLKSEDREKLEEYAEKHLHPALLDFQNKICTKFDNDVFLTFVDMLLSTKNSADEIPVNSLGYIFICQTDKTIKFIKRIKNDDKNEIIKLLEFGFANQCFINKKVDCLILKQKIIKLKKNSK